MALMKNIPGERRGSTLFTMGDGFYYLYKAVTMKKTHYICFHRDCGARIFTEGFGSNLTPPVQNPSFPQHNHESDPTFGDVCVLRETIIRRVEIESRPPKVIFDQECNSAPIDVASKLSFAVLEPTLRRYRRLTFPTIPVSADQFNEMLQSDAWNDRFAKTIGGKPFYRTNIQVSATNNLVFVSENVIGTLATCQEVHIDATFKTVPTVTGLKQLLVVMAVAYDYAFPVCFALMERKLMASYRAILAYLKILVPQMNPTVFISDFETAILRAIREEFPNAHIVGCWWHFTNCILKRLRKLKLIKALKTQESKRVIHMCMALPLLPPEKIEEGLSVIAEKAATLTNVQLTPLLQYIQSQWIENVGVNCFSVCDAERRTNNYSESFNMTLKREMHSHPNPWDFIEKLQGMENVAACNLERRRQGLELTRNQKKINLTRDNAVRRWTNKLLKDPPETTIRQFLEKTCMVVGMKKNIPQDIEDELEYGDEEEEEEEDIEIPPAPVEGNDADEDEPIEWLLPGQIVDPFWDVDEDRAAVDARIANYEEEPIVISFFSMDQVPTVAFVSAQRAKLEQQLANKEASVPAEGIPGEKVCLHCTEFKSTRSVVPCGHCFGCGSCCQTFIQAQRFFTTTRHTAEGEEIVTDELNHPLPYRCPICQALIGKLQRTYY